MHKAKVTSKGQITIPAQVRERMGLKTGEKVVFFEGAHGEFTMRRVGSIRELAGCLAGLSAPKTDEEVNRAIGAYVTDLDERTKSGRSKTMEDGEAA